MVNLIKLLKSKKKTEKENAASDFCLSNNAAHMPIPVPDYIRSLIIEKDQNKDGLFEST